MSFDWVSEETLEESSKRDPERKTRLEKFNSVNQFLREGAGSGLVHESKDDFDTEKYVIIEVPENNENYSLNFLSKNKINKIIDRMDAVPVFDTQDMAEYYSKEWSDQYESFIPVYFDEVFFDTVFRSQTETLYSHPEKRKRNREL